MPLKMANNATAHLAAPLAPSDVSVVLEPADIGNFPSLSAGQWHPMAIVDAGGHIEIVKVTARNSNLLTVDRAQEQTLARSFPAGSRAEIRLTAAAIAQIESDAIAAAAIDTTSKVAQAKTEIANDIEAERVDIDADLTAKVATLNAAIQQVQANLTAAQQANANSLALAAPVGTLKPWTRTTEPAGWIFADGRTLTGATPYTALRAAYIADGFLWGQDGSGNPKIPDTRGRTIAGLDNMGGGAAGRLTGATLGAALGSETHTLTTAQMPSHSHTGSTAAAGGHSHTASTGAAGTHSHTGSTDTEAAHTHTDRYDSTALTVTKSASQFGGGGSGEVQGNPVMNVTRTESSASTTSGTGGAHSHSVTTSTVADHSHTVSVAAAADHTHTVTVSASGSDGAHNNVQPTLVCHFIVKV
jgi:microcystin-dependent protein